MEPVFKLEVVKAPFLKCILFNRALKFKNFALTHVQAFPLAWEETPGRKDVYDSTKVDNTPTIHFDISNARGPRLNGLSKVASEVAVFYTRIEILAFHGNAPLGVVNHSSWFVEDPNAIPLLGKDREEWRKTVTPPTVFGDMEIQRDVPWYREHGEEEWMDIVVNNLDEKGHPFHLVSQRKWVQIRQNRTNPDIRHSMDINFMSCLHTCPREVSTLRTILST